MPAPHRASFFVLAALLVAHGALAQQPTASAHTDPPPADLAQPIAALLAQGGTRVTIAQKTLDFWWVKSLPLRSASSEVAWNAVDEGTLIGAVRVSANHTDIRGKTLKAGVYTLRFALQPQNGDHLGASPYREFLLLGPAAGDTNPAALGHDGAVDLAKLAIGTSHPAAWSIDPPAATAAPLTIQKNDTGLTTVVVSVPASRDGKDAGVLKFGVVILGTIQP